MSQRSYYAAVSFTIQATQETVVISGTALDEALRGDRARQRHLAVRIVEYGADHHGELEDDVEEDEDVVEG